MTVETMWKKLAISESELSLSRVLRCGQTFRWKSINNVWSFATHDRIILLKQDARHIYYSQVMREGDTEGKELDTLDFIRDYFVLDVKLSELYTHWKLKHQGFQKKNHQDTPFEKFTGIRILRQDPWECLISFICSSNNNVKRISKMCENLCVHFGNHIADHEGHSYFSFPTPTSLSHPSTESKLRDLGFGYRAKYIHQTALKFTDNKTFPDITLDALHAMRSEKYDTAHEFLLQLTGVGPKVADCICLMSLDKHDVVPIDTHVYQIAVRDYKFKGKKDVKTLNKETYAAIREFFKEVFGEYAGWAQSVLFAADLSDLNNGTNIVDLIKDEPKLEPKAKRIKVDKSIKVES
ncbi:N-glycosylase/DNA lyase [Candida viswanathii]|uniref:N-glycosylase/DNA lyase n=1 Tax=Candida viswanathii TaxID=5486 RepID=A0A367YKS2_9ASCO|nr:N-glycosylase/DNA lyase [Candida viswanathii]